jgi:signal transduction histidine kinase
MENKTTLRITGIKLVNGNCSFKDIFQFKRSYKFGITILLVASCFYGFGQNRGLDSLRNRIRTEKNDTEKVTLLGNLGNRLRLINEKECWQLQRKIDSIAKATGNEFFRAMSIFLAGNIDLNKKPVEAISNFEKTIKILSKLPHNRRVIIAIGASYVNLGLLHNNNSDYETAVYYYLKAEDIYLNNGPRNLDLAVIYSNLSITYASLNKYDEALNCSKKAIEWSRRARDIEYMMTALQAHGANLINAKRGGDLGIVFLDSAKHLAEVSNNVSILYNTEFFKAMYYYNNKQYRRAIEFYAACLEMAKKFHSAVDIGNNFINIAANEAELKLPLQAAAHLDSSKKYIDYRVASVSKQMYFENYGEVYKQLGNFAKAMECKDTVGIVKDALYQADNIKQLEFRQARYNYEKQQNEISQLEDNKKIQQLLINHKSTLNYIFIGSVFTLLLISLLTYRNYKQKQKLQQQRIVELETEKQLAATEAVLKGEEQERTRIAKDLHDGLGGMLSGIKYSFTTMKENLVMTPDNHQAFERSMDMLDSSIKEMRRVAHNMMPEALVRFGLDTALRDFCNSINQSGALNVNYQSIGMDGIAIDQTVSITLYRIVQELINNTMKHSRACMAIIQVINSDKKLSLTVEDDGKGFDTNILKESKGIGWTNIRNRIEFLKGKLSITSKAGEGTSVLIELDI